MNHAVLAPSAAHKWLNCPPSARLEEKFPEKISESALEGTFAHKFAEISLQKFFDFIDEKTFQEKISALKKNKFYSKNLEEFVSEYVDCVIEKFSQNKNATVLLEQKFDLSEFVPKSFGHADAIIISDGIMEICDLKYGAGVKVSAKNNP